MWSIRTAELAEDALSSLADGVTLVDETERVAFLNPRAVDFFGMTTADWLGAMVEDYYAEISRLTGRPQFLATAQESARRARELPEFELTLRSPIERVIQAKWFALRGNGEHARGYGILWRDVTHERELDQMKNQLLSTVSHELRTPLASIKGFATTLLRQDVQWDAATQREFLQIIEEESNRLEELIDNLLDMSQIEAGALRIQIEPIQLRRIVREAVDTARRRTETHWFVMDLPAELPRVWGDARRIRQVLNNLLENAVKYSLRGGQITITCEVVDDHVLVSVADQGSGIPPEYRERVFERFFQLDGATTRKAGGSGLGLAITKGIIQAHGGRIWVESAPGQGSVFRFTLPRVSDAEMTKD